ncbi:hypothetical protein MPSEU_000000100 [Mayamaea pseudoterrestris]|nr:hypothetical protein MPSEU_000000100 [Mayamaea pseudoterrestris]
MTNLKKSLQNRSPGLKNRHGVEKDDQKNCPFGPPTMCFRTLPPCKQNRSCLPSHRLLSQSVATDIRSHSLYCNETKMTFNSLYNSVLALHRTQQAPNASHGTTSGLLPSALRNGNTTPAAKLSADYPGMYDALNFAKDAMILDLGGSYKIQVDAVPSLCSEPFVKEQFFKSVVASLERSGAPYHAQTNRLMQCFDRIIDAKGVWRIANDSKDWLRAEMLKTDHFLSGGFVDGFGRRIQGQLNVNPSLRPDNVKYLDAHVEVSWETSPYAKLVPNLPPFHLDCSFKLLQQVVPSLDANGQLTMPVAPLTCLDEAALATPTPTMSKAGPIMAVDNVADLNRFIRGTYGGDTHLLDNAASFATACGANPIPYVVTTTEDGIVYASAEDIDQVIREYEARLVLTVHLNQIKAEYIGPDVGKLSRLSLGELRASLDKIKMTDTQFLTVSDYSIAFIGKVNQLPGKPSAWGINVVQLFFTNLSQQLKTALLDAGYVEPDSSNLLAFVEVTGAIGEIKQAATIKEKSINQQADKLLEIIHAREQLVNGAASALALTTAASQSTKKSLQHDRYMASMEDDAAEDELGGRPTKRSVRFAPANPPFKQSHQASFLSQAERTIVQNQPRFPLKDFPFPPEDESLVIPPGVNPCFACWSLEHLFGACPYREDPEALRQFFDNFHFYQDYRGIPRGGRLKAAAPPSQFARYGPTKTAAPKFGSAQVATVALTGQRNVNNHPAWETQQQRQLEEEQQPQQQQQQQQSQQSPPQQQPPSQNRAPLFVLRSLSLQAAPAACGFPLKSVAVEPTVPHIILVVGPTLSTAVPLPAMDDSCATISAGNLSWHQQFAMKHPGIEARFFSADALNAQDKCQVYTIAGIASAHGVVHQITLRHAVEYPTPFGQSLTFALGEDIPVAVIFGRADQHRFKMYRVPGPTGKDVFSSGLLAQDFTCEYRPIVDVFPTPNTAAITAVTAAAAPPPAFMTPALPPVMLGAPIAPVPLAPVPASQPAPIAPVLLPAPSLAAQEEHLSFMEAAKTIVEFANKAAPAPVAVDAAVMPASLARVSFALE